MLAEFRLYDWHCVSKETEVVCGKRTHFFLFWKIYINFATQIKLYYWHTSTIVCFKLCHVRLPRSTWPLTSILKARFVMRPNCRTMSTYCMPLLFNINVIEDLLLMWPRKVSHRFGKHIQLWNLKTPPHVSVWRFNTMPHIISHVLNRQHMIKKLGIGLWHLQSGHHEWNRLMRMLDTKGIRNLELLFIFFRSF